MTLQSILPWVLIVACASAQAEAIKKAVTADTAEKLAATIDDIHENMKPGGRYEFISKDKKWRVDKLFDQMLGTLHKYGSVEAIPERDKIEMYNAQEKVNGMLLSDDAERVVCERTAPTGSRIKVTNCETFGE
ncbi:MAG: hypothetical protein ABI451_13200, partial [Dokdonella sp.]